MMPAPKTGAGERPWDREKGVYFAQKSSVAIVSLGKNKMSSLTCHSCGGLGHRAVDCNTPFKGTWQGGRGKGPSTIRGHNVQRGSAARGRGRGGRGGDTKDRSRSRSPGDRGRDVAARGHGQARGRATERGRGRGTPPGRGGKRNNSSGGTPRDRSPAGERRARSTEPAKKRVSFETDAREGKKTKTCYYCGQEGHVAKDCTNEKSLRSKKLPWPQKRRIETKFTLLSRSVVKDWTSEELAMANELVRLAELMIDAKLNVVRATKEKELASAIAKKTISFWCRATNTRTDKEFLPTNNSKEEISVRILLWKEDIITTKRSLENQMDLFMRTVESTATAKIKQPPRIHTTSVVCNSILGKIWPKPETVVLEEGVQVTTHGGLQVDDPGIDVGLYRRVHAAADFVERLYAEHDIVTRQTVVDGVTQVVEKHARKEAMGRKVMVEAAGKEKKPVEIPMTVAKLKELAAEDLVKRNAIIESAKKALDPLLL